MKNLLIVLSLLMTVHAAETQAKSALEDDSLQIVMLDPERGDDILDQCSRESIYGEYYWQPTFKQIRTIEPLLEDYIKQLGVESRWFKPLPLTNWNRQVLGYEDEGVQYIYFNFYPKREIATREDRHLAVNVCGGGNDYWGVSFNLKDMTFSNFAMNTRGKPMPKLILEKPAIPKADNN